MRADDPRHLGREPWRDAVGREVDDTGAGGRAMEKLVAADLVQGVLDVTTTEVADEVVGGVLTAGPDRMDVILAKRIPYVLSLGALEAQYPAVSVEASPSADIAIVLGGATRGPAAPRPGPDLGEAADRVLFAADLYKAGKVKYLLVSGDNRRPDYDEPTAMRAGLIARGVPEKAITPSQSCGWSSSSARTAPSPRCAFMR